MSASRRRDERAAVAENGGVDVRAVSEQLAHVLQIAGISRFDEHAIEAGGAGAML
jgi:hypothetical protein